MDKLKCDRNLGNVVQRIRLAKKMKQTDVLTYMDFHGIPMTKSSYSKIEAGKQHLKVSELIALKRCFNVSYDDFFIELE